MIWIYVASAIFGGVFVIPMALGAIDFDADVGDIDLDVGEIDVGELDMGDVSAPDASVDMGDPSAMGAIGDFVASLLNFRSIVLGACFFGISGMVLTALGTNFLLTLISAIVLGFIAAAINSGVTTFVLNQQQSSHVTLRDMRGTTAIVSLPVSDDRRGRVRAQIAGQTEDFTALPYKAGSEFAQGDSVVIVEIEDGVAKVASLKELGS